MNKIKQTKQNKQKQKKLMRVCNLIPLFFRTPSIQPKQNKTQPSKIKSRSKTKKVKIKKQTNKQTKQYTFFINYETIRCKIKIENNNNKAIKANERKKPPQTNHTYINLPNIYTNTYIFRNIVLEI